MIVFDKNSFINAVRNIWFIITKNGITRGLDHRAIQPGDEVGQSAGEIDCHERLGACKTITIARLRRDSDYIILYLLRSRYEHTIEILHESLLSYQRTVTVGRELI